MSKLVDDIKALLALGVTQKEIAEASGVSRATICRFLAGKHCPSYFRAMQIRQAIDRLGRQTGPLAQPSTDQTAGANSAP